MCHLGNESEETCSSKPKDVNYAIQTRAVMPIWHGQGSWDLSIKLHTSDTMQLREVGQCIKLNHYGRLQARTMEEKFEFKCKSDFEGN